MDQEEEIEGLLDGTKSPHKQRGLFQKQGWIWIAFPTIFLLGLVTGWVLNSHLQTIPYAFDTSKYFPQKQTCHQNSTFKIPSSQFPLQNPTFKSHLQDPILKPHLQKLISKNSHPRRKTPLQKLNPPKINNPSRPRKLLQPLPPPPKQRTR